MSQVYFADIKVKKLQADKTLPAKFRRMLAKADLKALVKGKKVCVKMHLGGNMGYTTIHPYFVRLLVEEIKKAGARAVFVADGSAKGSEARGYTRRTIKAKPTSLFGGLNSTIKTKIGFKTLDEALLSKKVLNSDVLIVFSHVKGHGTCGFGAAGKNIAMGCVPRKTRTKLHALEGGLEWDESKCIHCNKCIEECPNDANKFDDKNQYKINFHNCTFCQHCMLACPEGAINITNAAYPDFQQGMALVVNKFLEHFQENIFFINLLTNITIFCDCWGMSTANLVPDIGILASRDIVSIDRASLDMIKVENFMDRGMPEGRELGEGDHLFEKIHGKNPYLMSEFLADLNAGSKEYRLEEIE